MLFSQMRAASGNRLVGQLLSLKRCFGNHAKIGIVVSPGKIDFCGTVAELIFLGHVPSGSEWIDRFILSIPTVREVPSDDFVVIPMKYPDGPPCPWDVAKREQELSRARAKSKRNYVSQIRDKVCPNGRAR